ncbi:uncharacterized protein LOC141652732 [Silene latifolia]|uniref:uncharacterized protein LOC141652732 n=1 Tax=Silene latifolia TaxID=37657 RepID=UPI003D774513
MKKKTQSSAADTTTTTVDDIKTLIHEHANFFDKLVEAIPARFYLPSNEDKPWFQGLSKAAKASAKRKTIQNLRIAKLNRFDPEKSSKTTVDVLNESLKTEKSEINLRFKDDSDSDGDGDEEDEDEGRKVTYEELQAKMRRKLEALKAGRDRGEGFERRTEKREEWKLKRKRSDFQGDKKVKGSQSKSEKEKESERVHVEKEVEEASKEIEFGKVKLAASIDDALFDKKKNKKRKLSKEEELKRALELEEAKKDPEKGNIVKEHAWKAATDRAMGKKVHDNPDRLKKSLDNDIRKQKKSKETWKKRLETTENHKKAKQEKRKANINAKLNTKKQTKMAKREKKFMRPGFEGRKEGFITGE